MRAFGNCDVQDIVRQKLSRTEVPGVLSYRRKPSGRSPRHMVETNRRNLQGAPKK